MLLQWLLRKIIDFYRKQKCWQERRRTRRYLAEMPAHLLKDIGLGENQRQEEVNKNFWQC